MGEPCRQFKACTGTGETTFRAPTRANRQHCPRDRELVVHAVVTASDARPPISGFHSSPAGNTFRPKSSSNPSGTGLNGFAGERWLL